MNLEDIVGSYDHEQQLKTVKTPDNGKVLYVAPSTDELPDDGVLVYSTIESLYDLSSIAERSVVLFRFDQVGLLACIAANSVYTEVSLSTLTGLPGADYSTVFNEATWRLPAVAYAPFIAELRLAGQIDEQLNAQKATQYDDEKRTYTRKSGAVKPHSDFKLESDFGDDDSETLEV